MGLNFAALASGYTKDQRRAREEKHEKEMSRREKADKLLAAYSADPNTPDDVKENIANARVELANFPFDKPYKFDPKKIFVSKELMTDDEKAKADEKARIASQPKIPKQSEFKFSEIIKPVLDAKAKEQAPAPALSPMPAPRMVTQMAGVGADTGVGMSGARIEAPYGGFNFGTGPSAATMPAMEPPPGKSMPAPPPVSLAPQPGNAGFSPDQGQQVVQGQQPQQVVDAPPSSGRWRRTDEETARHLKDMRNIAEGIDIPDDPTLREFGIGPGTYSPGAIKAIEWGQTLNERKTAREAAAEQRRMEMQQRHDQYLLGLELKRAQLEQTGEWRRMTLQQQREMANDRNAALIAAAGIRAGIQRDLLTMKLEMEDLPEPVKTKITQRTSAITALDTLSTLLKYPEVQEVVGAVSGSDWWSSIRQRFMNLTPRQQEFVSLLGSFRADQIHEKYGSALTRTETGQILNWAMAAGMTPENLRERINTTGKVVRQTALADAYAQGSALVTQKYIRAFESYGIPWAEIEANALQPRRRAGLQVTPPPGSGAPGAPTNTPSGSEPPPFNKP